jgi:transcription initiation factor TFIID subunit 10
MASSSSSSSSSSSTAPAVPAAASSGARHEDLRDFVVALDAYTPTVPESVCKYYMRKSGVACVDPRMAKLMSMAADRFLADTINEAKQIGILRKQGMKVTTKRKSADMSDVLEIEDLERHLSNQRINLKRSKKMMDSV